jgi:hypothetical protein
MGIHKPFVVRVQSAFMSGSGQLDVRTAVVHLSIFIFST